MSEMEKGFPYEASDSPAKKRFYPESTRPEKPAPQPGFIPDESAQTGNPGELGGGYASLEAGELKPSDIDPSLGPDWRLSAQTRQTGLEGIAKTREELRKATPPPDVQAN
jgi:hypothetical protein